MEATLPLACEIGGVYAGVYRARSLLGRGGSAEVYLVDHTTVHKPFALKVLNRKSRDDERALQRFRTEGRALFDVNHPNIVRVFHAGEDAELGPLIVMEVLEGKTLAQLLAMARTLPAERVIPLVIQIAEAVEVIHRTGIIHRDLKPGNIFIPKGGERPSAKLLDFGFVKAENYDVPETTASTMVGTGEYITPEQLSDRPVTPRTDVYALGHILYEALAGRHAHAPDDDVVMDRGNRLSWFYDRHATTDAVALVERVPGMTFEVSEVVSQAIARRPESRFESMFAFASALRQALRKHTGAKGTEPLSTTKLRPPPRGSMTFDQALAVPLPTGVWSVEALAQPLTQRAAELVREPAEVVARLRCVDRPESFDLSEGAYVIGRDSAVSDLVIDETSLSLRHARLVVNPGHARLEDLDSTNGIRIRGQARRAGDLVHAETIRLGRVHMIFERLDANDLADTEFFISPAFVRKKPSEASDLSDDAATTISASPRVATTAEVATRHPASTRPSAPIDETVTDAHSDDEELMLYQMTARRPLTWVEPIAPLPPTVVQPGPAAAPIIAGVAALVVVLGLTTLWWVTQ